MAKAAKYIVALGVVLAGVCALAGAFMARRVGAGAYEAAAVAAVINWIAGSLSLAIVFALRNSPQRINGVLLAMGSRMAIPMAAVVYFTRSRDPLAASGVVGLIMMLYLVGLIVETVMTVRLVTPDAPRADRLAEAAKPSH